MDKFRIELNPHVSKGLRLREVGELLKASQLAGRDLTPGRHPCFARRCLRALWICQLLLLGDVGRGDSSSTRLFPEGTLVGEAEAPSASCCGPPGGQVQRSG